MIEIMDKTVLEGERTFFNQHYVTALKEDLRQDPSWPHTFPATQSGHEIGHHNILHKLGELRGKHVLELGCGWGKLVTAILQRGGQCDAIDISDVSIELTKKRARANGFEDGYRLFCTSVEKFIPPRNYYDYVVGEAILHHVQDHRLVGALLFDALKDGGKAIFFENVCHNPVVNLLRWVKHKRMGSERISPAEKDLDLDKHVGQQLAQPFGGYHVEGQFLFYLSWRFTTNKFLLSGCFKLDKILALSFLARYYGIVLVELTKLGSK